MTVLMLSFRRPMISTSSPTRAVPRSTRPVATVPRPLIENTSSTDISSGLSSSRTGSGMKVSRANMRASTDSEPGLSVLAFSSASFDRP